MKHQWLAELSKQLIPQSEAPPKGYVCVRDAANELGVSLNTARRMMEKGVSSGKLDRVSVKRHNRASGQGSTFMKVWYYGKKK